MKIDYQVLEQEIIEYRRYFHSYPELSFQEFETKKFILNKLQGMGIDEIKHVGDTGLVAHVHGKLGKGKKVALRADMDALPVQETTEADYSSKRPGIMHACGHDAHMAMLLGCLKMLKVMENYWAGEVIAIFQPGEESPPGGARIIVQEGVMEGVDFIFGQHVTSEFPSGTIGLKTGAVMAAVDEFTITLKASGGHGAAPHTSPDPIVAACELVLALQSIRSRRVDPTEPFVLTVGEFKGGSAPNIIPNKVTLVGTVRTLNSKLRQEIPKIMEQIIAGITIIHQMEYSLDYRSGYPAVINNPSAVSIIREAGTKVFGSSNIKNMERSYMGGEDFSYFANESAGCFFFLGAGNKNQQIPWHNSKFDIDEGVLLKGSSILYEAVLLALTK